MVDIVYILTNQAMPGMVKIGFTKDELAWRIKGLYNTSVPLPFELFYACEVKDCAQVEALLHDAFDDHRVSKSREFFRIHPERIKSALRLAEIREIRLGDQEVFETPQEQKEVETAKRRSRFRFAMIGLKPGTVLELEKDPKITCTTVDELNHVDYNGNVTSLSDAALQAVTTLGIKWPSASGPWEWTYQGKRLDDIRHEIEEKAD
jgi:T5orf172 domain